MSKERFNGESPASDSSKPEGASPVTNLEEIVNDIDKAVPNQTAEDRAAAAKLREMFDRIDEEEDKKDK